MLISLHAVYVYYIFSITTYWVTAIASSIEYQFYGYKQYIIQTQQFIINTGKKNSSVCLINGHSEKNKNTRSATGQ